MDSLHLYAHAGNYKTLGFPRNSCNFNDITLILGIYNCVIIFLKCYVIKVLCNNVYVIKDIIKAL